MQNKYTSTRMYSKLPLYISYKGEEILRNKYIAILSHKYRHVFLVYLHFEFYLSLCYQNMANIGENSTKNTFYIFLPVSWLSLRYKTISPNSPDTWLGIGPIYTNTYMNVIYIWYVHVYYLENKGLNIQFK
jgi:hypothetical protein